MEKVPITSENIELGQFLKWADITATGGEAKILIQQGKIKVNGKIEKRRSAELSEGNIVTRVDTDQNYKVIKE